MKQITFNCFDKFKCKVQKCSHNCCIGWEIDIDNDTFNKYVNDRSEFSKKLLNGMDKTNKCFKKDASGRCVFLNEDNLCEIIVNKGINSLCQVCTDHPRFRNYFTDRVEIGFGISCEKACEMLLDYNDIPDQIIKEEDIEDLKNTDFENKILKYRKEIYNILNSGIGFTNKVAEILSKCDITLEEIIKKMDIKKELLSLERLNSKFYEIVKTVEFDKEIVSDRYSKYYERLLWYFITRHLPQAIDNLDIKSRTVFAVISVYIIYIMFDSGEKTIENLKDIAREYSSEIEYNDDNVCAILDQIDEVVLSKENR